MWSGELVRELVRPLYSFVPKLGRWLRGRYVLWFLRRIQLFCFTRLLPSPFPCIFQSRAEQDSPPTCISNILEARFDPETSNLEIIDSTTWKRGQDHHAQHLKHGLHLGKKTGIGLEFEAVIDTTNWRMIPSGSIEDYSARESTISKDIPNWKFIWISACS